MKDIKRLKIYLELVNKNIAASTGEVKEFWKRELRKTSNKIATL